MDLATTINLKRHIFQIVYLLLGLCLVYSLFYLASYFSLHFFVLSNRGMSEKVVSGSLLSLPLDTAVWGFSILAVLGWFVYSFSIRTSSFRRLVTSFVLLGLVSLVCVVLVGFLSVTYLVLVSCSVFVLFFVFSQIFSSSKLKLLLRLLVGTLLVSLFIEVGTLIFFSIPVVSNFGFGAFGLHWNFVELSLSNLAYPFLPYVYLLFVLLGVVGFLAKVVPLGRIFQNKGLRVATFFSGLKDKFELGSDGGFEFFGGRFVLIGAILIGAVISCLFVLFTVLPWTNPTNMLVSVDSPVYYQWIVYMHSVNVNGALSFALANDRALFLILAYALSFIASPLIVIQFVAALLIVLFGVVSLLVLRLLCRLRVVWVFGVLIVPFSFQALGLIYAGYFANMLALILVLVYVVLFFRLLSSWSPIRFFAMLSLSVLILLSHSWTWYVFAVSLFAFLLLEWRIAVRDKSLWNRFKEKSVFVVATVGIGLFVDLARSMLSPISSSASVLTTANSSLGFPNGSFLLSEMQKTVDFTLGGVFANGLLVFLSVVGFLVLLRFRSEVSNFFVSWVFVACLAISVAAQDFVFDRFLFLMPWVVFSSLGLFFIVQFASRHFSGRTRWLVCFVILAFVFATFLNFGVRYLCNINIW